MTIERKWIDWLALASIVLTIALGNSCVPSVISRFNPQAQNLATFVAMLTVGILASEVALASTIGAFTREPIVHRIAVALVALCVAAATYVLGLNAIDGRLPMELVLFVFAIAGVGFSLQFMLLSGIKSSTGFCIVHQSANLEAASHDRATFSIGFLLAFTGAAALIITIIRSSITGEWSLGMPPFYIFAGAAVYVVYLALVYVPCLWLSLGNQHRIHAACVLTADFLLLGPLALWSIHFFVLRLQFDGVVYFYAVTLGLVSSSTAVLLIFRSLGFRLRRVPDLSRRSFSREANHSYVAANTVSAAVTATPDESQLSQLP